LIFVELAGSASGKSGPQFPAQKTPDVHGGKTVAARARQRYQSADEIAVGLANPTVGGSLTRWTHLWPGLMAGGKLPLPRRNTRRDRWRDAAPGAARAGPGPWYRCKGEREFALFARACNALEKPAA